MLGSFGRLTRKSLSGSQRGLGNEAGGRQKDLGAETWGDSGSRWRGAKAGGNEAMLW
jgi:hypothetical protein